MKQITEGFIALLVFALLAGCQVLESIEKNPNTTSAVLSIGTAKAIESCQDRLVCADRYIDQIAQARAIIALNKGATADELFNIVQATIKPSDDSEVSQQLLYKHTLNFAKSYVNLEPVTDKVNGLVEGVTTEKAMIGLELLLEEIDSTAKMIRSNELRKLSK